MADPVFEPLMDPDAGFAAHVLSVTWDSYGRYISLLPHIKRIGKTEFPEDWIPDLLETMGLDIVVPYVTDFAQALAEGPLWSEYRGTDPAIQIGLGWVGGAAQKEPGDQRHGPFDFQIRFEDPIPTIDQMQRTAGIVALSKSTPTNLFRLFTADFDHRPLRSGYHRADQGLGDGYSGVRLWPGGPLISFGVHAAVKLDDDFAPYDSAETETAGFDLAAHPIRETAFIETADLDKIGLPQTWGNRYPTGSWFQPSEPAALHTISDD